MKTQQAAGAPVAAAPAAVTHSVGSMVPVVATSTSAEPVAATSAPVPPTPPMDDRGKTTAMTGGVWAKQSLPPLPAKGSSK